MNTEDRYVRQYESITNRKDKNLAVELNTLPSNNINNIDSNFERVEEALRDAVSRSGEGPNQMNADLDMNSNDLINVATIDAEDINIDGVNLSDRLEEVVDARDIAVNAANVSTNASNTSLAAAANSQASAAQANASAAIATNEANEAEYWSERAFENASGLLIASEAEAIAGVNNDKAMTPLGVREEVQFLTPAMYAPVGHVFGVDATADTAAIEAAVAAMPADGRLLRGVGNFLVAGLDLTALQSGCVVDFTAATISAVPNPATPAVKLSGTNQTVLLGDVVNANSPTGSSAAAGVGVLLETAIYSHYSMGQILGFQSPLECRPTRGFNGINGFLFNEVSARYLRAGTGDCFYGRANEGGGGSNTGYITESDWYFSRLDGGRGIIMDANATQIADASYRNNGNRFHHPGFENLSSDAYVLVAQNRTTLLHPRFEGPGVIGNYLVEDANCSRNVYHIGFGLRSDKLSLGGILHQVYALASNVGGGPVFHLQFGSSAIGETISIGDTFAGSPNGSLIFRDALNQLFTDRLLVKDMSGVRKRIDLLKDNSELFITAVAGTNEISVPAGTTLIDTNSTLGPVNLNMPAGLEHNGKAIWLNVRNTTNVITVKKSTGTAGPSAGITAGGAGLYALIYRGDNWRISKVGDVLSF